MALSPGSKGKDVLHLQRRLTDLGFYNGPLDAQYGPTLRRAVAEFRGVNGLEEGGGIADERTLALLRSDDARGKAQSRDTGEPPDVDEVQRHFDHLHRVVLEDDAAVRGRLLVEGFMEFGPSFFYTLGQWIESSLTAAGDRSIRAIAS